MLYTEDQLKKYLGILGDYSINSSDESNLKAKCSNCELLAEMGGESRKASKLIYLKISPQTLDNYENWWETYKSLKTG